MGIDGINIEGQEEWNEQEYGMERILKVGTGLDVLRIQEGRSSRFSSIALQHNQDLNKSISIPFTIHTINYASKTILGKMSELGWKGETWISTYTGLPTKDEIQISERTVRNLACYFSTIDGFLFPKLFAFLVVTENIAVNSKTTNHIQLLDQLSGGGK